MEYEWHASSEPLLQHFQIATWEVMEVLFSPRRWPRPATTRQGLPVLTVWGRTDAGRPLVVVLRQPRSYPECWQILMASPMGTHQLAEFTAWEATRNE